MFYWTNKVVEQSDFIWTKNSVVMRVL